MKKFLTALSLVLGLGLASAQQVTPAAAAKQAPPAKTRKAVVTKETKTAPATVENYAMKMKKDGTPDERYKVNQHLKKDGTPDKRYKGNR